MTINPSLSFTILEWLSFEINRKVQRREISLWWSEFIRESRDREAIKLGAAREECSGNIMLQFHTSCFFFLSLFLDLELPAVGNDHRNVQAESPSYHSKMASFPKAKLLLPTFKEGQVFSLGSASISGLSDRERREQSGARGAKRESSALTWFLSHPRFQFLAPIPIHATVPQLYYEGR